MHDLEPYFLPSNNGRYFKTGQGNPLVLLHGFAETYTCWTPLLAELSKQFLLIIPEIPSCGNEFSFSQDFSMEAIAHFVNEVLDQEGIEKVILFGHSMGGYAAMAFAELFPEKLRGISLVHSSASDDSDEKKDVRNQAIKFVQENGKTFFLKTLIPKLYADGGNSFPDEKEAHLESAMHYSDSQIIACYEAMKNRKDRTPLLSEFTFPVQFILGKEDLSIPYKQGIHQAQSCSITYLSLFEHVGHTSMVENPHGLLQSIIRFSYDIYNHFHS